MMKKADRELSTYTQQFSLTEVFDQDLLDRFELQSLKRGEIICSPDEPLEKFHLLVEGKLKIYTQQENGKKTLISFYRPLSVIGDLEFQTGYQPNAIVEAQEASKVLSAPIGFVRDHTRECPRFLRFVIKQLSHKLYTYSRIATMNFVYPLENRVASYLHSLIVIDDDQRLEEIRVNSMEEMANLLGTSYRHLSRVLKSLEERGILQRNRGKLQITNFEALNLLSIELFE